MVEGVEGNSQVPGVFCEDDPEESEGEGGSNPEIGRDGIGQKRGFESLGQQESGHNLGGFMRITYPHPPRKTIEELAEMSRRREDLRERVRLSGGMKEYAEKVGLTFQTISRMMNGDAKVSDKALGG